SVGSLINGDSVTLVITVRVNGTGVVVNGVNVSADQNNTNNDTNGSNVTENVTVVPEVNLTVTKTANVTSDVFDGDVINYTIVVTNHGHDNATGVVLNEVLPNTLVYVGSVASQGSYDPVTGVWSIGNLANGDTAILVITVQINGTGIISNGVNVTVDQTNINNDTNDSNITTNITVRPYVNLTITKTANVTNASYGQSLSYTITVTNHGIDNATNVIVSDILDPRLIFVGNYSGVSYYGNNHTIIWTIGNLSAGDSVNLTFTVIINGTGLISNVANVTTNNTNIGDNTTVGNNSTINIDPAVNLTVTKVANVNETVINGQIITYTISVTNYGPNNATGVIINEKLPNALIYLSSNASIGIYNGNTGIWTIGNLNNGQSGELVITVRVNGIGVIVNGINVTADQQNINNNTNNSNITENITAKPKNTTSHNTSIAITGKVSDNGKSIIITGRLTDENGNPLANKIIKFYVNGHYVGQAMTNNEGIAQLEYTSNTPLKNGDYVLTTVFSGDEIYPPSSNSTTLKFSNNPNNTTNNTNFVNAGVSMKKTGIPLFAILLVLLNLLGIAVWKKQKYN
ncbi:DUF11 domain-containing protein, partial [Methanobrevibacter sp. TMH8]|uniref:DUF11 domain-containing protein n=1 Tax=Methanobrevibacter sp. TMH8 TaxID=2848611 RepID=UPI001CCAA893